MELNVLRDKSLIILRDVDHFGILDDITKIIRPRSKCIHYFAYLSNLFSVISR